MNLRAESLQQRIALLTPLLIWEGRLNNARLRELFGISPVRASEWIREFREENPRWLTLDSKDRSYRATQLVYRDGRKNRLLSQEVSASLAAYLNLVGLPCIPRDLSVNHGLWAAYPDISTPNPALFAIFSEAIRTQRMVQISYRSMRDPLPHQRTISPHSIVQAGRRWHVRAFSAESNGFRDYALGRMTDAKILPLPAERTSADDVAWSTMVMVRLIAHPDLSMEQQDLIRFEYFNSTGARVDTCRGALVSYYIQDVRAAVTADQVPPDYQLAVENIEEVTPWLFPA